jgi:hypothetical protein
MPSKTLNDIEVLKQLKRFVSSNKLIWSEHVQIRMAERGFDKEQVKQCLKSGYFIEKPTVSNSFGDVNYKFKITAKIDGVQMDVVASLYPDKNIVLITIFGVN